MIAPGGSFAAPTHPQPCYALRKMLAGWTAAPTPKRARMTDTTEPESSIPAEPASPPQLTPEQQAALQAPPLPPERVLQGFLLSLVMIPAGIVVWVLIWQLGFISALVAFAVVIGVTFFYRLGSGGRIGKQGLALIIAVTLVTLVLAFLGGVGADLAMFLGLSPFAALGNAGFWDMFAINVFDNPALWAEYTPTILISLAFAALGTFSVFRSVAQEARASEA